MTNTEIEIPTSPELRPGVFWDHIGKIFLHVGKTYDISRGPTFQEICQSVGYTRQIYHLPLDFELEGGGRKCNLYARVATFVRFESDEELCQLGIVLNSRYSEGPEERPSLAEASLLVSKYHLRKRQGSMQVTPHVQSLIEKGETRI